MNIGSHGGSWLALALLLFTTSGLVNAASAPSSATGRATFAGGCFWCMEPPFDKLDGVSATISGYTGGTKKNPTYEEVSSGRTGHAEAVQITYDPQKITYEKICWKYSGATSIPSPPTPNFATTATSTARPFSTTTRIRKS